MRHFTAIYARLKQVKQRLYKYMTTFNIGIAGLGTVGAGVVRLIEDNGDLLTARTGCHFKVAAVSARSKTKDRGINLDGVDWYDTPVDMLNDDSLDLVLELIGGEDGIAKEFIETALTKGVAVVTANKALLAKYGQFLAELSEKTDTPLYYEAAIAGGIPIVKSLREGLVSSRISTIAGILNGTCNFIMTEMEASGADFENVLEDAQKKGYAEADPTFDIDGIDAAHKLSLLAAIGFGMKPDFNSLKIEGIRNITSEDIQNAATLGYKIKLLAIAQKSDEGVLQQVGPALIANDHALANVSGVLNAVYVTGDYVDSHFSVGPGAGQGPTASAVMSDIVDFACGNVRPVFGLPARDLKNQEAVELSEKINRFYLRLPVLDQPGVLAAISTILKHYDISIETLIQIGRDPDQPVSIVITTHETKTGALENALKQIAELETTVDSPCVIPIQDF